MGLVKVLRTEIRVRRRKAWLLVVDSRFYTRLELDLAYSSGTLFCFKSGR